MEGIPIMTEEGRKKHKWATFLNDTEHQNAKIVTEYLFKKRYIDRKSMYAVVKFALMHIYDEMLDELQEQETKMNEMIDDPLESDF